MTPGDTGITRLTHVTVLVDDQDEALAWYTEKLGFEKRADEQFGGGTRWVTVAPAPESDVEVVLQEPTSEFHGDRAETLRARVGEGTTWVLETDDCRATCEQLRARGVTVTSPRRSRGASRPWSRTSTAIPTTSSNRDSSGRVPFVHSTGL
jgi:catechol 2,3-dioxygenase-like lactoylglutathione lyase family enzyme